MKLFGASVASLVLSRCQAFFTPTPTCYAPLPPPTPTPPASTSARGKLRFAWLRFDELAGRAVVGEGSENTLGAQMSVEHRSALDEVVAAGELSAAAADLVQEAYDAALYHVWRSNAPITCYEPALVDYAPTSAQVLVAQSDALNEIAEQGTVDPATLEKAQQALEHDMAFYALSDQEVQDLYARVMKESQDGSQPMPTFEELQLELTPDARAAAQFILDLLSGK